VADLLVLPTTAQTAECTSGSIFPWLTLSGTAAIQHRANAPELVSLFSRDLPSFAPAVELMRYQNWLIRLCAGIFWRAGIFWIIRYKIVIVCQEVDLIVAGNFGSVVRREPGPSWSQQAEMGSPF